MNCCKERHFGVTPIMVFFPSIANTWELYSLCLLQFTDTDKVNISVAMSYCTKKVK